MVTVVVLATAAPLRVAPKTQEPLVEPVKVAV